MHIKIGTFLVSPYLPVVLHVDLRHVVAQLALHRADHLQLQWRYEAQFKMIHEAEAPSSAEWPFWRSPESLLVARRGRFAHWETTHDSVYFWCSTCKFLWNGSRNAEKQHFLRFECVVKSDLTTSMVPANWNQIRFQLTTNPIFTFFINTIEENGFLLNRFNILLLW